MEEAAEYLGCSRWTLRDQVTRDQVPHHRRGRVRGVYFTLADLEEIAVSQARRPGNARPAKPANAASRVARAPVPIPEEFARLRNAG